MKELDERIGRALGSRPVRFEGRSGGYSTVDRFTVTLADRRRVFVKSSDIGNQAEWLRREHEVYSSLQGPFIPKFLGWDDDGIRPVLAIEDLSEAEWTHRWDAGRVEAVLDAIGQLAVVPPPPNTHDVRQTFADLWGRWETVAQDPGPFLSTRIRDRRWLDRSLPLIIDAVQQAPIAGTDLCHLDVRSDNMCFQDGRILLVDWNWTSLANTKADVAAWLPSLHVEGGPPPWEVLPDAVEIGAWVAGVWAAVIGTPPPPTAPNVRAAQHRQLSVALDWLDRELLG